jgi:phage gp29-like protein
MLRAAGGAQSGGEIREEAGRSIVDWTPAMIKQALHSADGGGLRRVADLCDDILGDDRAAAVFATRRNALFASPLSFEASGDGRRKKRAVHALEAEEDWWTLFPEEELGELLTWGWLLGVGLGELVPPQDIVSESRYVPTLKVWHPRALRFDWPTRKWFLAIEGGAEIEIEPGDGRWILCTPYGRNRPWARGLWRGMAPLRLLKRYALADVGLYSEVHGQPIRVGFAPTGQGANASVAGVSPSLRKELAADLAQLGRDTVIALPPGFDFKLVEATAKTHEVFFAQIEMANTSFSVVAIGTNLPTEVDAGVGTGATAQNLVRQDYKRADAMMASTMTRWQALVWWAWWNFGDKALAPWPVWSVEPPEDKQATATTWKTVGDALVAFAAVGMKVEPKDLEERFGIKLIAAPELLPPKPLPPSLPGEKPGEPKEKTKPEDKQA